MAMRERWSRLMTSRVMTAAGWTLAGQMGVYVVRLASAILLTRLLSPGDYGAIAIVMVVSTILWLLSDVGIRPSVIRSTRHDEPAFLDTAWSVQLVRGLVIGLTTVLVGLALWSLQLAEAIPTSSAFSRPDLPWLIAWSAWSPIILGATPIRAYVASRSLEMKTQAVIDLSTQVLSTLVTLCVALWTQSVWSVIIGTAAGSLWQVWSSFRWIPGLPHRWCMDPATRDELLGFGRWILLSSALTALTLNGDRLLLGLWMDDHTLGLYGIALTLPSVVQVLANRAIGTVAHARLAEAVRESREVMQRSFRRFLKSFDAFTGSAAGFMVTAADALTQLLYDPRYAPSADFMSIMAWTLVLARSEVYNAAYLAQGHSSRLPFLSAVQCVALLGIVPLAHAWGGIPAALWALATRHLLSLPLHLHYCHRDGLLSWRNEWALLPALAGGALAGGAFSALLT